MSSPKGILVCCEIINGSFSRATVELLAEARRLAQVLDEAVIAAVIGCKAHEIAPQLSSYGGKHFLF